MSETREMTLGEKRCHINFNPSQDDKIGQFKRMMADAIDYCNDLHQEVGEKNINILNNLDPEKKVNKSITGTVKNNHEIQRCFSIAMEHLETAQMFGVKGIAKTLK